MIVCQDLLGWNDAVWIEKDTKEYIEWLCKYDNQDPNDYDKIIIK